MWKAASLWGWRSSDLYLAVDIGGTKTAAALIEADGQRIGAVQEPTCQMGPAAGIQQVISLLQSLLRTHDLAASAVHAIGIGIPAVLETGSDFVAVGPQPGWLAQREMRGPLEDTLARPVALEYDGHTAVLAEWWLGAGQGLHSFVNVIIGTGIGGGMVLEGPAGSRRQPTGGRGGVVRPHRPSDGRRP